MSRSYKKYPIGKMKSKFSLNQSWRRFRRNRLEEIPNGGFYKRTYPMWDVIDYVWRVTFWDHMRWHADPDEKESVWYEEQKKKNLEYRESSGGSVLVKEYIDDPIEGSIYISTKRVYRIESEASVTLRREKNLTFKYSTEKEKSANYKKWKKTMLAK